MGKSFVDNVINNATYFGVLTASNDYTLLTFESSYTNTSNKCHEYYKNFSDCVYFFFDKEDVDANKITSKSLYKIGKASGITAWYSRFKQYEKGIDGDSTNRFILNKMNKLNMQSVYVYAVATPIATVDVLCPLTGKPIQLKLRTSKSFESYFSNVYIEEDSDNSLPLCKQLV